MVARPNPSERPAHVERPPLVIDTEDGVIASHP